MEINECKFKFTRISEIMDVFTGRKSIWILEIMEAFTRRKSIEKVVNFLPQLQG